jgi:hypothetical protein
MGLFTRKKIRVEMKAYYIIDDNLYMFRKVEDITEKEINLTRDEFFNKYGFYIRKYNFEYDEFEMWYEMHCYSLSENPYDMTKAVEVREEDLESAIETVKKAFEKKFNDFRLDGMLYTSTMEPYYDDGVCFQTIVKPLRKLVNESEDNISRRFILEVEMLDGKSSETKCEFIHFYRFVDQYTSGCAVKVIESIHPNDSYSDIEIEDYFNL